LGWIGGLGLFGTAVSGGGVSVKATSHAGDGFGTGGVQPVMI
jgi:hypothetical protein